MHEMTIIPASSSNEQSMETGHGEMSNYPTRMTNYPRELQGFTLLERQIESNKMYMHRASPSKMKPQAEAIVLPTCTSHIELSLACAIHSNFTQIILMIGERQ